MKSEESVSIYIRDPESDIGGTLISHYYPKWSIDRYVIFENY